MQKVSQHCPFFIEDFAACLDFFHSLTTSVAAAAGTAVVDTAAAAAAVAVVAAVETAVDQQPQHCRPG